MKINRGKKKLLQSTSQEEPSQNLEKKKKIQRGIQIDHRGGKRIEKGKRRGAAINIGSGWFRRVERRPSKRQSPLLLSSFAMPSLRTGLVVTRVQPSANKEGRRNDERTERERERGGGTGRSTVLSSIKKRHRPPPGNRCTIPSRTPRIKSKNKIIGKRRNSASTGCPFAGSSR